MRVKDSEGGKKKVLYLTVIMKEYLFTVVKKEKKITFTIFSPFYLLKVLINSHPWPERKEMIIVLLSHAY